MVHKDSSEFDRPFAVPGVGMEDLDHLLAHFEQPPRMVWGFIEGEHLSLEWQLAVLRAGDDDPVEEKEW